MVAMRAFWMGVPLDCAVDDLVAESALGARREGGSWITGPVARGRCWDRITITDTKGSWRKRENEMGMGQGRSQALSEKPGFWPGSPLLAFLRR